MDEMLKDHLDLTTDEVLARLNGQWTSDVATYAERPSFCVPPIFTIAYGWHRHSRGASHI